MNIYYWEKYSTPICDCELCGGSDNEKWRRKFNRGKNMLDEIMPISKDDELVIELCEDCYKITR